MSDSGQSERGDHHYGVTSATAFHDISPNLLIPPPHRRWRGTRLTRKRELAAEWPALRRELLATLLARRVDPATAEDICQDVALRVLKTSEVFEEPRDMARWATTVALNLLRDLHRARRRSHVIPAGDLADHEDPIEHPDRIVAARAGLAEVGAFIASLRPHERASLMRPLDPSPEPHADAFAKNRDDVRRHRLRAIARGVIRNVPVGIPIRWHAWWRRQQAALVDAGHVVVGAGLSVAVLLGGPAGTTHPPHDPAPAHLAGAPAANISPADRQAVATTGGHEASGVTPGAGMLARPNLPPPIAPGTTLFVADPAGSGSTTVWVSDESEPKPLVCVTVSSDPALCVAHPLSEPANDPPTIP